MAWQTVRVSGAGNRRRATHASPHAACDACFHRTSVLRARRRGTAGRGTCVAAWRHAARRSGGDPAACDRSAAAAARATVGRGGTRADPCADRRFRPLRVGGSVRGNVEGARGGFGVRSRRDDATTAYRTRRTRRRHAHAGYGAHGAGGRSAGLSGRGCRGDRHAGSPRLRQPRVGAGTTRWSDGSGRYRAVAPRRAYRRRHFRPCRGPSRAPVARPPRHGRTDSTDAG